MLARREAAGERGGVIVHSTTACRWWSHLTDDKRMTDTFGNGSDKDDHGVCSPTDGGIKPSSIGQV